MDNKAVLKIYIALCLLVIVGAAIFGYSRTHPDFLSNFLPHPQFGDKPGEPIIQVPAGNAPHLNGTYVYECGKIREMNGRNSTKVKQDCLNSIGRT